MNLYFGTKPHPETPVTPNSECPAIQDDSQFEMATNSEWLPAHSSQFGMLLERRDVGRNSAVLKFG